MDCLLIRSKEISLKTGECRGVFGDDPKYEELVNRGPIIGLEFNGEGISNHCQGLVMKLAISEDSIFKTSASTDQFFHSADMHMNAF